ncbi:hypothetical protein DYH10_02965 [Candidatus Saccharibacteria bacterium CPR2]|nr:hypothetical protein [Candidatus Saccharibacteria bacterium CPR2]
MNKKIFLIIGGIIAVGFLGYVAYGQFFQKDNTQKIIDASQKQETNQSSASQYKSACDVFTLEIAKKHLGENARLGDTPSSDDSTEGDNLITSSCLYGAGEDSLESRNIQLNTAKNSTGEEWNRNNYEQAPFETAEFGEEEPPKLQQISGVGDKAYWNPQLGQLNVLIDNGKYWLTVQGSINDGPEEIEQHHKIMAQEIIANLE